MVHILDMLAVWVGQPLVQTKADVTISHFHFTIIMAKKIHDDNIINCDNVSILTLAFSSTRYAWS